MSILDSVLTTLAGGAGMTASQVKRESGGKQFDKDGKPLVGKYRDGSMPAPEKRAYGVAQMQVGTARDAAKRAGIPWDEKRFFNDATYNRSLGDAHMSYLNDKYGDSRKAEAAYHSGEGTVDKLLKTRGENWASGLGTHGKDYIGEPGGNGSTAMDTPSYNIPDILRDQGRTDGASAAPSQVSNPNQAGPSLREGFERVNQRAAVADDVLTNAINAMQGLQAESEGALANRNEKVNDILDEQATRTQQVMERIQPLFQQRRAVIDQKRRLNEMNPLERGIRSLFDQNYDREHLDQVSRGIDEELMLNGEEYKTVLGLQDQLLKIVDQSFQGVSMMNQLEAGNMIQNVELASKSLAAADAIWDTNIKSISVDQSLRAAQMQLAEQVLTEMTPGQINANLEIARKSPDGTVTVNGATLTEGLLLNMGKKFAEQQMNLDQFKLSMDTAAMNKSAAATRFQEESAAKLVESMTTSQIRQAINNGGQFNGVQIPLDVLGSGLQRSMGRDELMATGTAMQGAVQNVKGFMKSIHNSTRISGMRATQLTGGQPQELMGVINRQNPEVNRILKAIDDSAASGTQDQVAAQFMPRLQQMAKERQDAIDGIATRWAGNNKSLKPLATAFLTGTPLNGEDSARGIISLIRSGGQLGSGVSAEANAAINAAKRVIQQFDAESQQSGSSPQSMFGPKENQKAREARLLQSVSRAIAGTYSNTQFNNVVRNAPLIAKQIGHLGQNLDPATLRESIDAGDEEGYARVGSALGITGEQAKIMFAQGENSPLWKEAQAKAGGATFGQMEARLTSQQQMATFQYLDQNHPVIGKYKAGAVYANLLANPRFADAAGNISAAQGQQGFGDFLVSSMGQGTQTALVSQYGQNALSSYNLLSRSTGMRRAAKVNEYASDPWARTATVLGAIPDLNQTEEKQLLGALRTMIPEGPFDQANQVLGSIHTALGGSQNSGAQYRFTQIQRTMEQPFQDPALERIRQKAVKNFQQYSNITDEALDRLGAYNPEQ